MLFRKIRRPFNKSRRIAMIGPPGVGKTTTYDRLLEYRNAAGADYSRITTPQEIFKTTPSLEGADPVWIELANRYDELATEDQPKLNQYAPVFHRYLNTAATVDSLSLDRFVLFDESIEMRLLSVALRHPDGRRASRQLCRLTPPPRAIIHFDAPVETIFERYNARGKHVEAYKDLSSQEMFNRMVFSIRVVNDIARDMARLGADVLTIRLDPYTQPEDVAQQAWGFLQEQTKRPI